MIRLMPQTENRWLELPRGVKVQVRPRTTALDAAATSEATRRTAAEQREAEAAAAAGQPLDAKGFNAANVSVLNGMFHQFTIEALACMGILAWEGVGDKDGNPLELSTEAVGNLMAIPEFGGAFKAAYDQSMSDLVMEGNASPPTSDIATEEAASPALDANVDQETLETKAEASAESAHSS